MLFFMKKCSLCGLTKPLGQFYMNTTRRGKRVLRSACRECEGLRQRNRREADPEQARSVYRVANVKLARKRGLNQDVSRFILADSRSSDKKNGRNNDITRGFVDSLLANGCSYCGETELRMTLDRIDNNEGHTKDNVVSACIRCNYARRSMPHAAWLLLAPGMRAAREQGLFGDWTGRARRVNQ
jgi:hypothetical protein